MGCGTPPATTATTTPVDVTVPMAEVNLWDGTWILTSEEMDSPAGVLTSPLNNKILVIDDMVMTEDYSDLEGLENPASPVLADCSTFGEITSTLVPAADGTATVTGAATVVEPNISCGPGGVASTTAVPRTLTVMPWTLALSDDSQTITATAQFGPSLATHTYEKQ